MLVMNRRQRRLYVAVMLLSLAMLLGLLLLFVTGLTFGAMMLVAR